MRMHEYYFSQLEDGAQKIDGKSDFAKMLNENYNSFDNFLENFGKVAMSRGIGWTVLYWDKTIKSPQIAWVTDHELGSLAGLPILLTLDMWEHAFMVDYTPVEKGEYISNYFKNVNWSIITKRFDEIK